MAAAIAREACDACNPSWPLSLERLAVLSRRCNLRTTVSPGLLGPTVFRHPGRPLLPDDRCRFPAPSGGPGDAVASCPRGGAPAGPGRQFRVGARPCRICAETRHVTTEQPFFMALVSSYSGRAAAGASVRDARTGAVTDLLKPSAGAEYSRVTSMGEGVFFLTASGPRGGSQAYRVQVDAAGRAGELAPVPGDLLPAGCRYIAASPGGTILAYTVPDMTPPPSTAEAGLVDLATGERRITSLPAGFIRDLSLANDGQALSFQWQPRSGGEQDVYAAAAGASDWVSQGRVLKEPSGQPYEGLSPVISADGRAVYITVAQFEPTGGPHWNRLLEVPAGGGQPRVLFELRYQPGGGNFLYTWGSVCRDPAGGSLLAFATGYVYRIEISSGAVIRLPFPEGQPYDAAW